MLFLNMLGRGNTLARSFNTKVNVIPCSVIANVLNNRILSTHLLISNCEKCTKIIHNYYSTFISKQPLVALKYCISTQTDVNFGLSLQKTKVLPEGVSDRGFH